MIKNWPQFQGTTPYQSWTSFSAEKVKIIPLAGECDVHKDGFDCPDLGCTCTEYKVVQRTQDELEQIKNLQAEVRRDYIRNQALEIGLIQK